MVHPKALLHAVRHQTGTHVQQGHNAVAAQQRPRPGKRVPASSLVQPTWPLLLRDAPQHLHVAADLVDVAGAREQRLAGEQLPKHAAGAPHVYGGGVGAGPKQQLRCLVPDEQEERASSDGA